MNLRTVMVSHMVAQPQVGSAHTRYALEPQGEALFHQFGVRYEESETGFGNYSTAIVEWPDGRVESVIVDRIRFVPPSATRRVAPPNPTPPEGYRILLPGEGVTWKKGDLWCGWDGDWHDISRWAGLFVVGVGARPDRRV